MTSAGELPINYLAQRCAEETEKFNRREVNDAQFCFELLRRALAEGAAEAFTLVYHVYEPQVMRWVKKHPRFEQTGEDSEFFAGAALRTFYFALSGPKFGHFASLPKVLQYLKLCVHTTILQYIRDQQPAATMPYELAGEVAETPDLGMRADAADTWSHINQVLTDERDRLLARCVFLLDLKPRQIIAAYPGHWRNEREISVALYRVRRTLRNDPELQQRAGLLSAEEDLPADASVEQPQNQQDAPTSESGT